MHGLSGTRLRRYLMGLLAAAGIAAADAAAVAQGTGGAPAGAAQGATYRFDIPAKPLPQALADLGRVAGLRILYTGDQPFGISAGPLVGSFTADEALRRLLAGTGMVHRFANPATVTLERVPAPSADGGAVTLDPVNVEGQVVRETAWGPVPGFVASRAATATKTDTPLIETPQSISVVTRDQMTAQGAQSLNQALRYTAAVVPETRGATATRLDQMTIRGFSPTSYLDGMRLFGGRDANPSVDMFRLERVEVMRGPSSVLYGQAGPGGMVNMVSKRPLETPFREVTLQGGTFDHLQATIDSTGPLDSEGRLLYRVAALARKADGQVERTKEERLLVAPSLTWRPDEDTSLTILTHYQSDPHAGSYGSVPAFGSVLPNPNGKIPVDFYDGDPNFEKLDREQYALGYAFEHRFDDVFTVRQNARYLHTEGVYRSLYNGSWLDDDYRTIHRSAIATDVDVDALSLDSQLQAKFETGPLSHTLLLGADYLRAKTRTLQGFATNVSNLDLFDPVYGLSIPVPAFTTDQRQRQSQFGLYAQEQLKFDRLVLVLGGRYDWAETRSRTVSLVNGAITRGGMKDEAFTGRAGLVYLFDNGLAPYVSYTESFEPQSGFDFSGKPFKPTEGRQYEIGIKYQPTGFNSFITLSLFDLRRKNVLTTDPEHPTHSIQTGEVRSRGIELEGKASLAEGLNVTASYAYLDNETTKSNSTTTVNTGIVPSPPGAVVPLKGKVPVGIPKHTASLWADYTFQEGSLAGFGIGGGVRYLGSSYGDPANTFKVPATTLFDAAISYDFGRLDAALEGVKLSINATNIFDKKYTASCLSYSWCWYGYQRTVMATLKYQW